ncbi:replication fork protection complex subunit TIPIN/Csm3/Swi3 [Marchantia polymorpha subsp. ruderalis]|uniref:CCHC-type domain-containing protein n=2 Tax=Marchantia polymorpha TaxID=3197 RepID=A0A176VMW7_MARPO|nr:hypothetical protein AXG93_868s1430 [Marchantia polymorpha subsp. ruderalis]PTQ43548.1 hypothetical protein MARPO_0024s0064 [Marchantia polymorpha]BBN06649.1 hypothetical protein Mp_3g22870 [Marchantia polymorpha subsp. ruderalis]|eukprot:PTQ43548.1 hypothetical protein MARPO_0024s0064 [Marchantia polymorpha]
MATNGQETNSLPTGCFKCGRPGHWSRDCPARAAGAGGDSTIQGGSAARAGENGAIGGAERFVAKSSQKAKGSKAPVSEEATAKVPRKRPTLTADLLLSDNGLGFLLEKMPQIVRIRGEGHEVHDLKSLLEGYVHWHSQLHPYLGFSDFVAKVEKLGALRRVRMCVRELRDKITSGSPLDVNKEVDLENIPNDAAPGLSVRPTTGDAGIETEDWLGDFNEVDEIDATTDPGMPVNEDEFEDFFRQGTTQVNDTLPSGSAQPKGRSPTAVSSPMRKLPSLLDGDDGPAQVATTPVNINEALAARMQANRQKALERAKARRATNASV